MTPPSTFSRGLMAVTLLSLVLSLAAPCRAEPTDDPDFAALQAEAKKSFQEVVTPFVDNYCTRCHGQERQKGGINFGPALKKPGETASSKRWKQAVAIVKSHEMPPEDTDKQPTEKERQKFLEGISKIKYLSSKDP